MASLGTGSNVRRVVIASIAAAALFAASCGEGTGPAADTRMTLDGLLLEDARTCAAIYTYPQALIDGLSTQLIEELRCMDDRWLEFYEPCQEPGCIWPHGPQPVAARPEVLRALEAAAAERNDFISITAAYRDVAMQYYSRWYKENCNSDFAAAQPGGSNHQGGRAIDVRYYDYWWDTLLDHGFEHPYSNDRPHFELLEDEQFRDESLALRSLSITAFQRLWNRNHPDDTIPEDGVYGPATKARLGASPVEGFAIGACAPGSDGEDTGVSEEVGPDAGDVDDFDASDASDAPDLSEDAVADTPDVIDAVAEVDVFDASTEVEPDSGETDVPDAPVDAVTDTDEASDITPDSAYFDAGGTDGAVVPGTTAHPLPRVSVVPQNDDAPRVGGCSTAGGAFSLRFSVVLIALLARRRRP